MNKLMAAILLRTIQDWENEQYQTDIESFLESRWFVELTEALNLKPHDIRLKLLSGEYEKKNIRAAYR